MKVIDRYIAAATAAGTGLSLLALASLDGVLAFVAEVPEIGREDYGLLEAVTYVLLTLPRRAFDLFPTAALLGALLGVGALAVHSELVALRAVGISRRRISLAVLGACALLLLPMMLLGEWIAPASEQAAQELKVTRQARDLSLGGPSGLWVRQGDAVINAERLLESGALSGVTVYEFDTGRRLAAVTRAEFARPVDGEWELSEVRATAFGANSAETSSHDEQRWPTLVDASLLQAAALDPQNISLRALYRFIHYLEDNNLDAERYEQAFWSRIFYPVTALALVIAGLPFVFGPLRQGGFGLRLFLGIAIGLVFFLVNRLIMRFGAVYDLEPALVALVPPLAVALAAWWYLRRTFA